MYEVLRDWPDKVDSVKSQRCGTVACLASASANLGNPPSRGVPSETAPPENPGPIATEPKTRPEAVASAATPTHPERFATARPVPIMVGKIDVSHFASIKPGDTPAQVVAIYGQPDEDNRTYQFWANDGHGNFMVSYLDNVVEKVEAYSTAAVASSSCARTGKLTNF